MADLEFQVAKRRKDPITFKLLDEDYTYSFIPPKTAAMVLPILDGGSEVDEVELTRAAFDWLGDGLSEEEENRILGRLRDPDDDLDVDTLTNIVQKLGERSTARPTT